MVLWKLRLAEYHHSGANAEWHPLSTENICNLTFKFTTLLIAQTKFFLQHKVPKKRLCWLIVTHMEDCLCFWHILCTNLLNARLFSIAQTMDICSCQHTSTEQQSVAQSILHPSRKKITFSSSSWYNRCYQEFFPLKEQSDAKYINVLLLP